MNRKKQFIYTSGGADWPLIGQGRGGAASTTISADSAVITADSSKVTADGKQSP